MEYSDSVNVNECRKSFAVAYFIHLIKDSVNKLRPSILNALSRKLLEEIVKYFTGIGAISEEVDKVNRSCKASEQ